MSEKVKPTRTVVPAQPGFDVVVLCNEPAGFIYYPVIAWVVTIDDDNAAYYAEPVRADDATSNLYNHLDIIRQPDGTIVFVCDCTFAKGSEAEALAYAIEKDKRHEAALRQHV